MALIEPLAHDHSAIFRMADRIASVSMEDNEQYRDVVESMLRQVASATARVAMLEANIEGTLNAMPARFVVRVREGGGPEELAASLAVSVSNLTRAFYTLDTVLD